MMKYHCGCYIKNDEGDDDGNDDDSEDDGSDDNYDIGNDLHDCFEPSQTAFCS